VRECSANKKPFWAAFGKAGVPGTALKVLLLTGQRPGEISRMNYSHLTDNWWEMPGLPEPATEWPGTKNAQSHRIWLPTPVRDLIAELGSDRAGYVFGRVLSLDVVMRDICQQLGAPRATPHDLRRTFGTMVTSLGFGRPSMDRLMNHREGGVGSVYDRYEYASENQKIMESVASRIIALAEGIDPASNVVSIHA
jgi:integrase